MTTKKTFDFLSTEDFDKHIEMIIPNYSGLSDIFTSLAMEYMPPTGVCVDLGCSTGKFINNLPKVKADYYGVDNTFTHEHDPTVMFIHDDIQDFLFTLDTADVIVSMFTLQFLGKYKREAVVGELRRLVDGGAVLLIAEKVFISESRINHTLHRAHIQEKRKHFTADELLDKDFQLMGSMFCKTDVEIQKELSSIGNAHKVWQSYNFMGWCVTNT